MSKLSRREMFGFGAAIAPAMAVREVDPKPPVLPEVHPDVVRAAERFVRETLPRCRGHFFTGTAGKNWQDRTAYRFSYSGSGQDFCVTALDRLAEVVMACVHDGEQPTFGVMDKRDWTTAIDLMTDLLLGHDPTAALHARQRRDLSVRHLWWEGIPWFWTEDLEPDRCAEWTVAMDAYWAARLSDDGDRLRSITSTIHPQPHAIYVVNLPSLDRSPRTDVLLNGFLQKTDCS